MAISWLTPRGFAPLWPGLCVSCGSCAAVAVAIAVIDCKLQFAIVLAEMLENSQHSSIVAAATATAVEAASERESELGSGTKAAFAAATNQQHCWLASRRSKSGAQSE